MGRKPFERCMWWIWFLYNFLQVEITYRGEPLGNELSVEFIFKTRGIDSSIRNPCFKYKRRQDANSHSYVISWNFVNRVDSQNLFINWCSPNSGQWDSHSDLFFFFFLRTLRIPPKLQRNFKKTPAELLFGRIRPTWKITCPRNFQLIFFFVSKESIVSRFVASRKGNFNSKSL